MPCCVRSFQSAPRLLPPYEMTLARCCLLLDLVDRYHSIMYYYINTSDDLHWMTCTAVSIRVQPEREREREERERERKTERQRDRETYLLRCDEEGTVVSFINLRLSQNRNGPITEPGTLPLVSMPVQLLKRASNR